LGRAFARPLHNGRYVNLGGLGGWCSSDRDFGDDAPDGLGALLDVVACPVRASHPLYKARQTARTQTAAESLKERRYAPRDPDAFAAIVARSPSHVEFYLGARRRQGCPPALRACGGFAALDGGCAPR
jgi:hypothetical protein